LPAAGDGILFLDELNAAPPLVQAACYQLVLDRRLGEYRLPDGWSIVAAGNRETARAITHRMPSVLANRFCPPCL
jgi:MoxR-like ATPase